MWCCEVCFFDDTFSVTSTEFLIGFPLNTVLFHHDYLVLPSFFFVLLVIEVWCCEVCFFDDTFSATSTEFLTGFHLSSVTFHHDYLVLPSFSF